MDISVKWSHYYAGAGALITWAAVLIQFVVMLNNRTDTVGVVTIHFLSYFTILSNILVALSFTLWFYRPAYPTGSLFGPGYFTAICVYIIVVGLIYNLVLRKISTAEGPNRLPNELLHVLVPLMYLVFWLLVIPKGSVTLQQSWSWLIFPACYFLYTILHGKATGFYPYPFTNITELGLATVLRNCALIAILFWFLSALLVGLKSKVGS